MSARRNPIDPAATGPLPPDNEPGHHPEVEQDKPLGKRPRPKTVVDVAVESLALDDEETGARPPADERSVARFPFAFSGIAGVLARAVVLHERRARVEVTSDELIARYGPWTVRTPLANVDEVSITGPYATWKVAGTPHLSFSDRGLTFATNADRGVCIRFVEPVAGIEPTGRLRHPGLTVTVADPEGLRAELDR